ncbi:glycoside hydrolase family 127 protein [Herbiconiux sp. UC225_62]|uniref:glycoside hydrolase family 127 protein n=1 Tax=Herbiconiux sp. UC225_62 TaxID=3350168 RepID=UPI0036D221CD
MPHSVTRLDQGRPVAPTRGTLRPLGISEVRITDGFWADRQDINARTLIEHCEQWIARSGWVDNFDAAREGRMPGAHTGREFADSDVYKLLEAMAWEIGRSGDQGMNARFEALVDRIEPVQEPDGYLNTYFGRPGQASRYSDLEWGHELYCYGHLLQAAVARGRTTGEDRFVEIARRAADHVCAVFGAGGIERVCGHPEIEVALVEFARYTGDDKYLEQARLFVERRGHHTLADIEFGRAYFQDETPLRDTAVMAGHAVRALYLAAGGVDLAVETDDRELLEALRRQLGETVARRTYLTGGMGAHHEGESFGQDHELPADRSYSESCAGVGSVMVNFRLLLATGEAEYADLIERTLYNVVAGSPNETGTAFFYTNTLHQRVRGEVPPENELSPRASSSLRAPWFEVSCCPTNVARTFASLGSYLATTSADGLQIHQYAGASIAADLDAGPVAVQVETRYPDDGLVRVSVTQTVDSEWEIGLRVPGWADTGATLRVNDSAAEPVGPGAVPVRRRFAVGDTIELALPIAPRFTAPDPRIDAVRGSLAVEAGPIVYCLESPDLPGGLDVDAVRLDASAPPTLGTDGITVALVPQSFDDGAWPYRTTDGSLPGGTAGAAFAAALIPYHRRANRGPATMRVWMPCE